ncbi:MAG: hypothetical protein Q9166_001806 [cf. Caloplaca sp. 2 TL-2023]
MSHIDHETRALSRLSQRPGFQPGKKHITRLLDDFKHMGPNGTHSCLVLELLGRNVFSKAKRYEIQEPPEQSRSEQHGPLLETFLELRIPGEIAWKACKQTAEALGHIHATGIAHGDLNPHNIVYTPSPEVCQMGEDIMRALGPTETGDVNTCYGHLWTHRMPRYQVASASLPSSAGKPGDYSIKLVDFGRASLPGETFENLCSFVYRAPEGLLTHDWGMEADIWSLGCTMAELIVGCSPFEDNSGESKDDLIRSWALILGGLPEEWKHHRPTPEPVITDAEPLTMTDWLHEAYFDGIKDVHFAEAHIEEVGELLESMIQYRPSDRPNISQVLKHPWFKKNPFTS